LSRRQTVRAQWKEQLSTAGGTKTVQGSGEKDEHFVLSRASILSLINEPAVVLFGQASLVMRNLRTKRREDFGWGYTNQPAEEKRG